jgi:hypothetical protein
MKINVYPTFTKGRDALWKELASQISVRNFT